MKTPAGRLAHGGFTLIELVAVCSMLAVLVLLIAATLWGAVKIERADSSAFHRMTLQARLSDQFRDDVRQAVAAPNSYQEFGTDSSCVILKMDENRYVVYRWIDERLTRTEIADANAETLQVPVGGERISVQFGRSSSEDRVVSMWLLESRGPSSSFHTWPVVVRATIGADHE